MSSKSDITKALRKGGYKLQVRNRKQRHLLYVDKAGNEFRMHLGGRFSTGLARCLLQQIRSGSSRAGRKP